MFGVGIRATDSNGGYLFFWGGGGREGYRGGWAQRSNSMKFLEFPDIS